MGYMNLDFYSANFILSIIMPILTFIFIAVVLYWGGASIYFLATQKKLSRRIRSIYTLFVIFGIGMIVFNAARDNTRLTIIDKTKALVPPAIHGIIPEIKNLAPKIMTDEERMKLHRSLTDEGKR